MYGALDIHTSILGAESTHTAVTMNNLGVLLTHLGRLDEVLRSAHSASESVAVTDRLSGIATSLLFPYFFLTTSILIPYYYPTTFVIYYLTTSAYTVYMHRFFAINIITRIITG